MRATLTPIRRGVSRLGVEGLVVGHHGGEVGDVVLQGDVDTGLLGVAVQLVERYHVVLAWGQPNSQVETGDD